MIFGKKKKWICKDGKTAQRNGDGRNERLDLSILPHMMQHFICIHLLPFDDRVNNFIMIYDIHITSELNYGHIKEIFAFSYIIWFFWIWRKTWSSPSIKKMNNKFHITIWISEVLIHEQFLFLLMMIASFSKKVIITRPRRSDFELVLMAKKNKKRMYFFTLLFHE